MSGSNYKERDREWLKRMCEGEEGAFEHLFLAYYEDLCQFASRYISSPEEVEDLVQDVFLNIWKRRQALDPEQSIRGYLYSATRNESLKYLNRQKRRPKSSEAQQEPQECSFRGEPGRVLQHSELETEVQEALDALPDRRREIFLLSRRHELTYAEIAKLLEISVKTVETQMGRALSFLEKRLPVRTES